MAEELVEAPFGTVLWMEVQPVVKARLEEWGYVPSGIKGDGISLTHYWRWTGFWGNDRRLYERTEWRHPEHGEWIVGQIQRCWNDDIRNRRADFTGRNNTDG